MDDFTKLEIENLAHQVKYLAALRAMTVTQVKEKVNEKYNKIDSNRNLSNKFHNKTIRVSEIAEILDVLGYELYIRKIKHSD